MNKEYSISTENKIILSTDEGLVVRENSDNIDEILVKENLLEKISDKIVEYTLKRDKLNKNIEESIFIAIFIPIFTMLIVTAINLTFGPTFYINKFNTIFGTLTDSQIYFNIFCIIYSLFCIKVNTKRYLKSKKEKQGITNDIDYLTKIYRIEKEKLEELYNEKTNNANIEQINKIKKVNDIEVLEKLKNDLILYYNCGCEEKKYRRWQEKNKLKDKLEKEKIYDEEEIDKIETILTETAKEKTKVKKYDLN